jgi:hypothetical protein
MAQMFRGISCFKILGFNTSLSKRSKAVDMSVDTTVTDATTTFFLLSNEEAMIWTFSAALKILG